MVIIVVSRCSCRIATTFSAGSVLSPATWWIQNTLLLSPWKARTDPHIFWICPSFQQFLQGLFERISICIVRPFPTTKGHSLWMWSLCFLFDPSYLLRKTTCRCCSPLASAVSVAINPVISSVHFRAKPALRCFLIASFCTPHSKQARKTTLKLCSSTQLPYFS